MEDKERVIDKIVQSLKSLLEEEAESFNLPSGQVFYCKVVLFREDKGVTINVDKAKLKPIENDRPLTEEEWATIEELCFSSKQRGIITALKRLGNSSTGESLKESCPWFSDIYVSSINRVFTLTKSPFRLRHKWGRHKRVSFDKGIVKIHCLELAAE